MKEILSLLSERNTIKYVHFKGFSKPLNKCSVSSELYHIVTLFLNNYAWRITLLVSNTFPFFETFKFLHCMFVDEI